MHSKLVLSVSLLSNTPTGTPARTRAHTLADCQMFHFSLFKIHSTFQLKNYLVSSEKAPINCWQNPFCFGYKSSKHIMLVPTVSVNKNRRLWYIFKGTDERLNHNGSTIQYKIRDTEHVAN